MALLKSLRLSNFKSIGAEVQEIEFASMTLLFGPNSAGKSTVLQALIFAREAIVHGNLDPDSTDLGGDWLDLGGFENLVHGRNREVPIGLGFSLGVSGAEVPSFTTEHETESLEEIGFSPVEDLFHDLQTVDVDMQVRWSEEQNTAYVERYSCCLDGELVAVTRSSSDGRRVFIDELPLSSQLFQVSLDVVADDRSLSEILAESLSQSVVEQSSRPMREIGTDRPYASFNIDELGDLVADDGDLPRKEVLEKMLEELRNRSSRRAAELERRITELVTSLPAVSSVGQIRLNLRNQSHALPSLLSGLVYDDDAWSQVSSENESDGVHERAIGLFLRRSLDTAICGPLACVASFLENMNYIGPLRDLPPRRIEIPKTKSRSRWAKGLAAWETLPLMEKLTVDEINYWLGKGCLNTGYQVLVERVKELADSSALYDLLNDEELPSQKILQLIKGLPGKTRITLQDEGNGLSVMPQDIGVGISQLFPVVVASVFLKDSLIAIEQPELHIHPRLQTELADLFIRCSIDGGNQFLLETHSEHLMLRLLRRVRESKDGSVQLEASDSEGNDQLESKDLAVHYVEPTQNGTKFTRLRVTDDGDFLDEWPAGFFEERDDELFF